MAILVDEGTRVLVQGITGRQGAFHTKLMINYGTKVVAGVTPGKGGSSIHGVPVYNSVLSAIRKHPEINTSIVFVPAQYSLDAVLEALEAGIEVVVVITEGIPLRDELILVSKARSMDRIVVGPNTPGVISPGIGKVGIMPSQAFSRGVVGVVSRSGTLTYEVSMEISEVGLGQSTVVGIGGDPVTGLDFVEVYEMFTNDPATKAIVIIGEIGGDAEERLADYIERNGVEKPTLAYIAGMTAPPGKRMGHAGAIISMGLGTWESKREALESAGVMVFKVPWEISKALLNIIQG